MINSLLLPNSVNPNEIQEILDGNPEAVSVMRELQDVAEHMQVKDLKLLLHKEGLIDPTVSDMPLTFKEFIEVAIMPHHPLMGELYPVHEEWIRLIEVVYPDKNLIIFAPVDSWKSTIINVNYVLYLIYLTQGMVRVGSYSAGEDLAKTRVVQCRTTIEQNPVFPSLGILKPERPTDWGETSFTVVRKEVLFGSTLKAYGIGAETQGSKVDVAIYDDVVSVKNSSTETQRTNLERKFRREVLSRLTKKPPAPLKTSRILAVCTAYRNDDLNAKLAQGFTKEEESICQEVRHKAIYEAHEIDEAPEFVKNQIRNNKYLIQDSSGSKRAVGFLFPERLTYKFLLKEKNKQGSRYFAQNYQQQPLSDDDYTVNPEWIRACYAPTLVMGPELWFSTYHGKGYSLIIGLDPAIVRTRREAERKKSDFWVMQATAYSFEKDDRVIIDFRRGRGIKKNDLRTLLKEFFFSFVRDTSMPGLHIVGRPAVSLPTVVVESNQGQDFLAQDIEDDLGRTNVRSVNTTMVSKNDGFTGLPRFSYVFEMGGFTIPTGNARSLEYAELLLKEASEFGFVKNDDVAMVQLIIEDSLGSIVSQVKSLTKDPTINSGYSNAFRKPARHFNNIPPAKQRRRLTI